ncbi:hypothetical protein CLIB1423_04S05292 [[Candida] railenensis]|uniref:Uncharacterized protein n=1 Tax=[Candida] railenensis TaxID=45579 RepID=A0A9P0QNE9_9ASCO|nr:hypothetical protein CLIB1423_04S05292 [[Candida] railenensis]
MDVTLSHENETIPSMVPLDDKEFIEPIFSDESTQVDIDNESQHLTSNEHNVNKIDRKFVVYNEPYSGDVISFVSEDAHDDYELFLSTNTSDSSEQQSSSSDTQRSGIALPLLSTQHHLLASLISPRYMSIYRYQIPPESRVFDKLADRYLFCEVKRRRRFKYHVYEFKFTPNPLDDNENFKIFMVHHRRYKFADISLFNGHRYRWIAEDIWSLRSNWNYQLHQLKDGQRSLFDNFDEEKARISKKNELARSTKRKTKKRKAELSGEEVGIVVNTQANYKKRMPANFCLQEPSPELLPDRAINLTSDYYAKHRDSINSVSTESLVFLCMASIFKCIEDNR